MPNALDLTGQKFGLLTAIKKVKSRKGHTYWLCECECGQQKEIQTTHLTRGKTKSCGSCLKKGTKEISLEKKKCILCGQEFQPNNGARVYCYECNPIGLSCAEAQKRKKQKLKQLLVKYKGGKCERCGYNKSLSALHFHHKNKQEKEFSLSQINLNSTNMTLDIIKKEIDKCELLCANCHAEEHGTF